MYWCRYITSERVFLGSSGKGQGESIEEKKNRLEGNRNIPVGKETVFNLRFILKEVYGFSIDSHDKDYDVDEQFTK